MQCDYCQKNSAVLRRNITASGISQFLWYCPDHDNFAKKDNKFIPHGTIKAWIHKKRLKVETLDEIPIWRDYSKEAAGCCICGEPAEMNHWAPQSLADYFGEDWFKWPTAPLCKMHHDKWHNIVTWYLPGRTDPELAAEVKARYFGQEQDTAPDKAAVGLVYVKARVQAEMSQAALVLEAQP